MGSDDTVLGSGGPVPDGDETVLGPTAPPVVVDVQSGDVNQTHWCFTTNFIIGRSQEKCQLVFRDRIVSRTHAELRWEQGQWWIYDLDSRHGTFVNDAPITRERLPCSAMLQLGRGGPRLLVEVDVNETSPRQGQGRVAHAGSGGLGRSLLANQPAHRAQRRDSEPEPVSEHSEYKPSDTGTPVEKIRDAMFGRLSPEEEESFGDRTRLMLAPLRIEVQRHRRFYHTLVKALLVVASGALLWAMYWHFYFGPHLEEKYNLLISQAAALHAGMKATKLEIARLEGSISEEKMQALRELSKRDEAIYQQLVKDSGKYKAASEEDQLILRMANRFGECELTMPEGFATEVKRYIGEWQKSKRLENAINRAKKHNYDELIAEAMDAEDMPQEFFYLALQESNFDFKVVGPPTRLGYAKGMWQFIPSTGEDFKLKRGPLWEQKIYDELDERHDVHKSTRAAAQYLKYLYQTDAQASGLLVMASYNWGQGRVIKRIRKMPHNPRERNFWQLLKQGPIPKQTRDYVFMIFSAAVIAENPRLFRFDFDNPLALETRL